MPNWVLREYKVWMKFHWPLSMHLIRKMRWRVPSCVQCLNEKFRLNSCITEVVSFRNGHIETVLFNFSNQEKFSYILGTIILYLNELRSIFLLKRSICNVSVWYTCFFLQISTSETILLLSQKDDVILLCKWSWVLFRPTHGTELYH